MANTNPAHVVLTNVRLSYVHLTEPYAQQPGQEPKYSAVVLVPKANPTNKAKIDAAIQAAAQRGREKFGQAFPAQPNISVHDGDGTRPSDGQPFGEECRGCWVFTASSKQRPNIVDNGVNINPILDPSEIYSGIYANVGVTFFPYSAPQKKGIGVGLENVQKIADGEPLGGSRASAEEDFAATTQPAAAPYQQPPAAYSPAPANAYYPDPMAGYPAQGYPQQ